MIFKDLPQATNIIIKNVKEDKKYGGRYKRIFQILNRGSIFCQSYYESDYSPGWIDGDYYLQIDSFIDCNEYDEIAKLKNVEILD